jgi:hypothetical protein
MANDERVPKWLERECLRALARGFLMEERGRDVRTPETRERLGNRAAALMQAAGKWGIDHELAIEELRYARKHG